MPRSPAAALLVRCGQMRARHRRAQVYRADYDHKLQTLRPHPVHDWTSHAADAFRYLAMTLDARSVSGFYRRIEYGR
jgi:hypothetical protein